MSYVVVEFQEGFSDGEHIDTVYGTFESLEAAEAFRNNHPRRLWMDTYIVCHPSEENT